MAFPILKIQFPLLSMCLLSIQRGWGWGVEVVSSAGFLPYGLFSSLFKCLLLSIFAGEFDTIA